MTKAARFTWRKGREVGKYRLDRKIGRGGFAVVYKARDTVQRIDVALKLPLDEPSDRDLDELEDEIEIVCKLDHPNILPVLNADYVFSRCLVVAHPLGERNLGDRMDYRMATHRILTISEQILAALGHAHDRGVIHCDVKPENLICFPKDHVKLGDFGMAKLGKGVQKTSHPGGTLGYMAPELAMGYPEPASDVFSAGILIYEMLARDVPEWPFDWPPPGLRRVERLAPELLPVLRRATRPEAKRRYKDAKAMLTAFLPAKRRVLARIAKRRKSG